MRILIIEDDPNTIVFYHAALREHEITFRSFVPEKFNYNNYDIILLDLQLPEVSGEEVLRQTSKPVIIVSALEKSTITLLANKYNSVQGFIQKPFNKDKLKEMVCSVYSS